MVNNTPPPTQRRLVHDAQPLVGMTDAVVAMTQVAGTTYVFTQETADVFPLVGGDVRLGQSVQLFPARRGKTPDGRVIHGLAAYPASV